MSFIKSGWFTIGHWWARIAIPVAVAACILFLLIVAISALAVLEAAIAGAAAAPTGGGSVVAEILSLIAKLPAIGAAVVVFLVIWALIFFSIYCLILLFIIDNLVNFFTNLFSRPGKALGRLWQDIKSGAGNLGKGLVDGARAVAREAQKGVARAIGPLVRTAKWIKSWFD